MPRCGSEMVRLHGEAALNWMLPAKPNHTKCILTYEHTQRHGKRLTTILVVKGARWAVSATV